MQLWKEEKPKLDKKVEEQDQTSLQVKQIEVEEILWQETHKEVTEYKVESDHKFIKTVELR